MDPRRETSRSVDSSRRAAARDRNAAAVPPRPVRWNLPAAVVTAAGAAAFVPVSLPVSGALLAVSVLPLAVQRADRRNAWRFVPPPPAPARLLPPLREPDLVADLLLPDLLGPDLVIDLREPTAPAATAPAATAAAAQVPAQVPAQRAPDAFVPRPREPTTGPSRGTTEPGRGATEPSAGRRRRGMSAARPHRPPAR